MNIVNDMIAKLLETPEVINQLKKSLVNRDLAIEIDGVKFQIMKKNTGDEVSKLKQEIRDLKSKLYDIEAASKALLEAKGNECKESERLNDLVWNQ
jgi:hypothetical protein